MKDLAPNILRQRLLIEGVYAADIDQDGVEFYLTGLAACLNLRTYGKPIIHAPGGLGRAENAGFDAFIPLIDSGISLYVWSESRFFAAVLFTCKAFDVASALSFTQQHFQATELVHQSF